MYDGECAGFATGHVLESVGSIVETGDRKRNRDTSLEDDVGASGAGGAKLAARVMNLKANLSPASLGSFFFVLGGRRETHTTQASSGGVRFLCVAQRYGGVLSFLCEKMAPKKSVFCVSCPVSA